MKSPAWFEDFFQAFLERDIKSCRIFQVWVSPFQDGRAVSPIGGQRFFLWKNVVDNLLETSLHFDHAIDFQYEIYVDDKIYEWHTPLRQEWQEKYPGKVIWTNVRSLIEKDPQSLQITQKQCESGCAASCSDLVRCWNLVQPRFAYNMYIDVDTIEELYRYRKGSTPSSLVFGARASSGIYMTYLVDHDGFFPNNDVLIALSPETSQWEGLQNDMRASIAQYEKFYNHMATQHARLYQENHEEYDRTMRNMVTWAQNNPVCDTNQYSVILSVSGPGFWIKNLPKDVMPNKFSGSELLTNDFSWKDPSGGLSYACFSFEILEACYGEKIAQKIILLNLYLYDYLYIRKQPPHPKRLHIEQACMQLWLEIAPALQFDGRLADQRLGYLVNSIYWHIQPTETYFLPKII